jgi:hypothetical protein
VRPWPFSVSELTAGLRRYFAAPTLQVKTLSERPLARGTAADQVRGLHVEYVVGADVIGVDCVVKEPLGATRAGLAGVGRREVGLYRSLAVHLPMNTPALIAADSLGGWLILEAVDAEIAPEVWRAQDYREAVRQLAALHERFWNLTDDLATYAWLARPLTGDFEIHVFAAAQALEKMVRDDWPPLITESANALVALAQMITQAEAVAKPLRATPPTLLHGDFWPGNVSLLEDGEMVVYDWQQAGLGPGVLDMVTFVSASRWARADLPLSGAELVGLYRAELAQRVGASWTDREWSELWDHALIWRFMQEMLAWLAHAPREVVADRSQQFDEAWLQPVMAALGRRLGSVAYL